MTIDRHKLKSQLNKYYADNCHTIYSDRGAAALEEYLRGLYPSDKYEVSAGYVDTGYYGDDDEYDQFYEQTGKRCSDESWHYCATPYISGGISSLDEKTPDTMFYISVKLGPIGFVLVNDNLVGLLEIDGNGRADCDDLDIACFNAGIGGQECQLILYYFSDCLQQFDVYRTFTSIPHEKRGVLAAQIGLQNCLDIFEDDIPSYAFYGYHNAYDDIGRMKINAARIGPHAFDGVEGLKEVYLGKRVQFAGEKAFSNSHGLIIHCAAASQPGAWSKDWRDTDCTVIWGDSD